MRIVILDGSRMTDKQHAHDYLEQMLHFPEYYGHNLDALADCLSELGPHTHIILTDADVMRTCMGEYGQQLIDVFRECSEDSYTFHFAIDGE